jgi:hypothetical protein
MVNSGGRDVLQHQGVEGDVRCLRIEGQTDGGRSSPWEGLDSGNDFKSSSPGIAPAAEDGQYAPGKERATAERFAWRKSREKGNEEEGRTSGSL